MKLYTNPLSPNCRRVDAVVAHLGLSVDRVTVDMANGEHRKPEYLAINPNGKVPSLVDGNRTLWESTAIMAYLASKKDTALWPKNDDRYTIMKWMSWQSCHFAPAVGGIIGEVIFKPMRGGSPDQSVIDKYMADFRTYASILNGELEKGEFLVGNELTLADLAVGVWLGYGDACKLPIGEYGQIKRWWGALSELQAGKVLLPPRK